MDTRFFKLTASLLVLATAAVPAAADDAKNYPGAVCLASGSLITRVERPSTGRALNAGPSVTTFQCPLVRDADDISSAKIHVIDESPSDEVHCWLRSRSLAGTFAVGDDGSGNAFHGSDPTPLSIGSLRAEQPYGYYILSCEVPAPFEDINGNIFKSGIVAIYVNEND